MTKGEPTAAEMRPYLVLELLVLPLPTCHPRATDDLLQGAGVSIRTLCRPPPVPRFGK